MKIPSTLAVLLLASVCLPAAAQTDHKVFTSENIDESELVRALTPPPKTRSFGRDVIPGLVTPTSASLLITFKTNSATIMPEAKPLLDALGHTLSSDELARFNFSIEGHADRRGNPNSNQLLSEQRAKSVRQYLVQTQKIKPSRLHSLGKGDREPLNPGDPAAPVNRRVEIVTIE